MAKVVADISMSLDGFVTGPAPDLAHGLGHGGESLHRWAIESSDPVDVEALQGTTADTGAVVMGRRLFDTVDGPHGWSDEMGYGARLAATPPFFVVTHRIPEATRLDLDFTFVTEGLEVAIAEAVRAADARSVFVMGGADVVRQAVVGGLADELRIHLAPVILGAGTPLFGPGEPQLLVQQSVAVSQFATHLTFAIPRSNG
jgi:dihydrofolate reductase